jgi:malonate transporter and related proteins
MSSILTAVLPIFALVFAGYLVRRLGVLGPHATSELNRFVVNLALPALLFDIVAHAKPADIWQPGFIGAYGLSSMLIFALIAAVRFRHTLPLTDAAIDGLNAGYPNTGFMGFPLALAAFGRDALAPTLVATLLTVCGTFLIAIVVIEIGLQTEKRPARLVLKVGRSLLLNPLFVAPALATIFPLFALGVPGPVETFFKLLGGAASPCALVTLGLFLAEKRETKAQDNAAIAILVGCKLILQPLLAWVLAGVVFNLTPLLTHTAVLLAALPTGTGPFMLAEFYRREAQTTSKVILASTVLSVATLSLYLAWIG